MQGLARQCQPMPQPPATPANSLTVHPPHQPAKLFYTCPCTLVCAGSGHATLQAERGSPVPRLGEGGEGRRPINDAVPGKHPSPFSLFPASRHGTHMASPSTWHRGQPIAIASLLFDILFHYVAIATMQIKVLTEFPLNLVRQ